jgi:hypothetical protein
VEAAALAVGRCSACDAPLQEPQDSLDANAPTLSEVEPVEPSSPPTRRDTPTWPPVARQRIGPAPRWLGGAGVVVLFSAFLVGALFALGAQQLGGLLHYTPRATVTASASPLPSAAPTTPTTQGQTPTPAVSPSPHASPSATLIVDPTAILLPRCLLAQTHFTIANTGSAPFAWTATANVLGERITPTSGTLGGDKEQTVDVSRITASGTITVTAPAARNSPQHVTITCHG